MLLYRHVYSSWILLHRLASLPAFSLPKCLASSWAIDSVDSSVPYASNAITILAVILDIKVIYSLELGFASQCTRQELDQKPAPKSKAHAFS